MTMKEENEKEIAARKEKRKRKRELSLIIFIISIIIFLSFLQSRFFRITGDYPYINNLSYFGIIHIIIILILVLAFLVIRNLVKLFFEHKKKRAGSRLRTKLSLAFILLSLIPTLLLFIASVSILKASIESWFSSQVEESLEESYEIAQTYYENVKTRSKRDANLLSGYVSKIKNTSDDFTSELLPF